MQRDLEDLVFRLANLWQYHRRDARLVGAMAPSLASLLDEIEKKTRGDDRRCYCLTGKETYRREHDVACPAYLPAYRKEST